MLIGLDLTAHLWEETKILKHFHFAHGDCRNIIGYENVMGLIGNHSFNPFTSFFKVSSWGYFSQHEMFYLNFGIWVKELNNTDIWFIWVIGHHCKLFQCQQTHEIHWHNISMLIATPAENDQVLMMSLWFDWLKTSACSSFSPSNDHLLQSGKVRFSNPCTCKYMPMLNV